MGETFTTGKPTQNSCLEGETLPFEGGIHFWFKNGSTFICPNHGVSDILKKPWKLMKSDETWWIRFHQISSGFIRFHQFSCFSLFSFFLCFFSIHMDSTYFPWVHHILPFAKAFSTHKTCLEWSPKKIPNNLLVHVPIDGLMDWLGTQIIRFWPQL